MESGALSAEDFPAFANKVVPFLHMTTRIEGHPYDGLLKEKGFRGFPSLAFMDAQGNVAAIPTARSVESFEATLVALDNIEAVRARAETGGAAEKAELLLLEHALGSVKAEVFKARAAELGEVPEPFRSRVDQVLVDNEIWRLVGIRDEAEKSNGMLALFKAGKRPSDAPKYAINFWSTLGQWGQKQGDAQLLRDCAEGIRNSLASNERMQEYAASLEKTAKGLDERDALLARRDKGETGLEAEILLVEVRLDAIDLARFRGKLEPALAVATAEQKEELLQAQVDLEANEIWMGMIRRRANADELGRRAIELLYGDGRKPSSSLRRNMLGSVARWADNHLDELEPETLRRLAKDIREHFSRFDVWKEMAARFQAQAEKLEAGESSRG